jgi:hypothetical protein
VLRSPRRLLLACSCSRPGRRRALGGGDADSRRLPAASKGTTVWVPVWSMRIGCLRSAGFVYTLARMDVVGSLRFVALGYHGFGALKLRGPAGESRFGLPGNRGLLCALCVPTATILDQSGLRALAVSSEGLDVL